MFTNIEAKVRIPKTSDKFYAKTMVDGFVLKHSNLAEAVAGVFSLKMVKKDTVFGPFIGITSFERQDVYNHASCWNIVINQKSHLCIDGRNSKKSNWMKYVNRTPSVQLQNLEAFQHGLKIYFRAIKDIPPSTELLVWYSNDYNQDHSNDDPKIVLKPYKCDSCNMAFRHRGKLVIHNRIHTGEKPYKCDICNRAFSQQTHLHGHKLTHTGEKSNKCDICNMAFSQKGALRTHNRTHTGEKPYKCDICNRAFSQKIHLQDHKRNHTGEKPYKCDICKMTFSHRSALKRHRRIHTGEKPYKCDICIMAFSYRLTLKRHRRTHTGEKPYKCGICKRAFMLNSHFQGHKRTHTSDKSYKCDICNMAFSRSCNMIIHKRTHTSDKATDQMSSRVVLTATIQATTTPKPPLN